MKEIMKRRFAVMLALVIMLCCVPEAVFAAGVEDGRVPEEDAFGTELENVVERMGILGEGSTEEAEQEEKLGEAAAGEEEVDAVGADSGTCGENLSWTLDDNGVLTISGTGEIGDYKDPRGSGYGGGDDVAPWFKALEKSGKSRADIHVINVENGVTAIGMYAFSSCPDLASVTIADSVESMDHRAFGSTEYAGDKIKDFTIGSGLKYLNYSFYGCKIENFHIKDVKAWCMVGFKDGYTSNPVTNAENVYVDGKIVEDLMIPEGTESIGKYAFYGYEKLKSVSIPKSLKSIGGAAFANCDNLGSINVADLASWCGVKLGTAVKNGRGENWDLYENGSIVENLMIPEGVEKISDYAFTNCSSIKNVNISNGVKSIGKCAFDHCSGITEVTIPSSVENIGINAFCDTDSIGIINIMDLGAWCKIEFENESANPMYNSSSFAQSRKLYINGILAEKVSIPGDVIQINDYAFVTCGSLAEVRIASSVTSIGKSAFGWCYNLKEIIIPESVSNFGENAFSKTPWLEKVLRENENGWVIINQVLIASESNMIPDGVIAIGSSVFKSRKSLTEIVIPESVTRIEDAAFAFCDNLASVMFLGSVENIGANAFESCSSLKTIILPESVVSIGEKAFYMGALTEIEIPANVKEIGANAFSWSKKLKKVSIQNSELIISEYAFEECDLLEELSLGSNVTEIAYSAFYSCDNLPSVTIPNSVKSIGKSAFRECEKLSSVAILPGNNTMTIDSMAFRQCTNLPEIDIPDNVESIGDWAFYSCYNLKKASIGAEKIGYRAFSSNKLENVIFTDHVSMIGKEAFENCSLKNIIFGNGIKSIEVRAFGGDDTLQIIKFKGDAVPYGSLKFGGSITMYAPDGNATWTKAVKEGFGVSHKWGLWNPVTGEITKEAEKLFSSKPSTTPGGSSSSKPDKDQTNTTNNSNPSKPNKTETPSAIKKGSTLSKGKIWYTVTDTKKKTVTFKQLKDPKATKFTIPDTVKYGGKTYKVTAIAAKAFKGNKKLKKITIGKNIQSIGREAFSGCSKLSNITIKTTKLKSKTVGVKAFKGIAAKAKIKVPKSKKSAYKKLLIAKGAGKKVKIT